MAEDITGLVQDVRVQDRISKAGGTFQTLEIQLNNTLFSGYLRGMIKPQVGDKINLAYETKTRNDGTTFNQLVNVKVLDGVING